MNIKRFFTFAAVILVAGYSLLLFRVVKEDNSWSEDFTALYTGWMVSLSSDQAKLYDLHTQRLHQTEILSKDGHDIAQIQDHLLPYLNPPHVSILFAPLALLPRQSAFVVWMLIQIAMLLLLWGPIRDLTDHDYRQHAILAALAFPPTMITLGIGALSVFVAVAIMRADYELRRGRFVAAALCLAVATVKPQMLLFSLVVFLIAHRWRLLVPFSAIVAALCVGSLLLVGPEPFYNYPPLLAFVNDSPGRLSLLIDSTATLRGILFAVFGYQSAGIVNPISTVVMLFGLLAVAVTLRKTDREFGVSLAVLLGLFLGLHVNPQDNVLLVFPALMLYHKTRSSVLGWALCIAPFVLFFVWRTQALPLRLPLIALILGMLAFTVARISSQFFLKTRQRAVELS